MKIIIFGLFDNRMMIERVLDDSVEIIGYSDGSSFLIGCENIEYKKFIPPEELNQCLFDYIVLCISDKQKSQRVLNYLTNQGIDPLRIVPTWWLKPAESGFQSTYDDFFKSPMEFDGAVFGMSYSRRSLKTGLLNGSWFKFSLNGMDLRGDELYIRNLKDTEKFKKIKRVILDIPYFIFNWDISSSHQMPYRMAIYDQFNEWGHYLESNSSDTIVQYRVLKSLIEKKFETCRSSLSNDFGSLRVVPETELKTELSKSVWQKIHEKTIQENIEYFVKICQYFKELGIEFYVIVFPYAPDFITNNKKTIARMRKIFYQGIKEGKKIIDIKVIDFLRKTNVNVRNRYFYNATHINEYGSVRITEAINRAINGIQRKKDNGLRITVHIKKAGWDSWVRDGEVAGCDVLIDGIKAFILKSVINQNIEFSYSSCSIQSGWGATVKTGEISGKEVLKRKNDAISKIKIRAKDNVTNKPVNIYYCVYSFEEGWSEWTDNGNAAGNEKYPISAIRVSFNPPEQKL